MSSLLGSCTLMLLYRFMAGNGSVSSESLSSRSFATVAMGDTAGWRELGVELVRSSSDVESLFELKRKKLTQY